MRVKRAIAIDNRDYQSKQSVASSTNSLVYIERVVVLDLLVAECLTPSSDACLDLIADHPVGEHEKTKIILKKKKKNMSFFLYCCNSV